MPICYLIIALPPRSPTVTVVSRHTSSDGGCGEARILNCTANTVDNLFIPPIVMWIGPNGSEVSARGSSNPMINPQTGQLIFRDVTTTNKGLYICRTVINISEAHILNHFDDTATNVNTNGE